MESKLRESLGVEIEIDDLIHAEPISHLVKALDVLDDFLRMGGNVSLAEFEYDTGSQIFVALEKLAEFLKELSVGPRCRRNVAEEAGRVVVLLDFLDELNATEKQHIINRLYETGFLGDFDISVWRDDGVIGVANRAEAFKVAMLALG